MTTTDPKLIERIARALSLELDRHGDTEAVERHRAEAEWPRYVRHATAILPIAAAAINEAAHQWQDIATAPSKCCIDVWVTLSGGYRLAECYYDTICGQWRTSRPSGQLICIPERHVSHWQPLPSPPAIEAHKESQHGA